MKYKFLINTSILIEAKNDDEAYEKLVEKINENIYSFAFLENY